MAMNWNGKLAGEDGVKDFPLFVEITQIVYCIYKNLFGEELMNKYDLFVDNATAGSGHAPVTLPAGKDCLLIKLRIEPEDEPDRIAFTFAHELLHCVFCARFGTERFSGVEEEALCTAASFIIIKEIFPFCLAKWEENWESTMRKDMSGSFRGEEIEGYRRGTAYAREINYDMETWKKAVLKFMGEPNPTSAL